MFASTNGSALVSDKASIVSGATILDGVSTKPMEGRALWIEGGRIKRIAKLDELGAPSDAKLIEARGKYLIPGLMNANVHLMGDVRVENLLGHLGRYESLIAEAAQVALKNGMTTVFDTWGPRQPLITVRDRIAAGEMVGSRIFCAGNIVGFDGPFSSDFIAKAGEVVSGTLCRRINAMWVENVGRHLMWLPPAQVAREVRTYIEKGIDFVKYGSNEHFGESHGAFLAFSERVQAAIVAEAHRAGITAQAHTMSVEGLWMAIEAGSDVIQHANHSGPVPIPEETVQLMAERKTGAVVFPLMQQRLDWLMANESYRGPNEWRAADDNARHFIRRGVHILLGNDGLVHASDALSDPLLSKIINSRGILGVDNLYDLATGHFVWLKAMEEKGMAPMEMLRAATRNIAVAYGKEKDLGTLEEGKIADLLILDKDPLQSADHYRSIHMILKDGRVVDRSALPLTPVLTGPGAAPADEEAAYVQFLSAGSKFPLCPLCLNH